MKLLSRDCTIWRAKFIPADGMLTNACMRLVKQCVLSSIRDN